MKGRVLPLYVQVGIAEITSVAVCLAIRAAVGQIFHGADRRDFLEALAVLLHRENRHESLCLRANRDPPSITNDTPLRNKTVCSIIITQPAQSFLLVADVISYSFCSLPHLLLHSYRAMGWMLAVL